MAKRFFDTGLFEDSWFMDLSKDGKIAWIYLLTKCDHAGIIEINEKLFKTMTGINSWGTVEQELGNRLVRLRGNYYFIPKFIFFQYPDFPKSKVNTQAGAIKRLNEFGLFNEEKQTINEQFMNSSGTVPQDLPKSYGYGNDNIYGLNLEKGGMGEKTKNWRNDYEIFKNDLWREYSEIIKDEKWIHEQERLNPGVDIPLSIEKSIKVFWETEAGWKNKKKSKAENPDWKLTFAKNLDKNKVYKPKQTNGYQHPAVLTRNTVQDDRF